MQLNDALRLRILQLCVEQDLTIGGLCTQCGITPSTLNNIVSGRNRSATVSTIQKVCNGLEIDLSSFFQSDLFHSIEQEL